MNILVSNYTNKHLTFHKGEYVGHLEPAITDDITIDQTEANHTNSITLQKMMAEQVKQDVFDPTHHTLSTNIQNELDALLKQYELQFAKDETSIGTKPLTSMMTDPGIQILFLIQTLSVFISTGTPLHTKYFHSFNAIGVWD